ncbi:beta strand repeat-containing protein, partial [uncultured Sphingomonas sp.]|uniref:beta strand repeat-containing protein n=1 Tax=uncultured Sphingomonas sp. TaxID=158754 RepID=UPI0035CC551E
MRHAANFRRFVLASSALAFAGGASPANAATCVWNGGAGDWSAAASWSCGSVPGSGDAVFIDSQPGTSSLVSITSNQAASTLTLDGGDRLGITNAQLAMYGGSLTANGDLSIGANSYLTSGNGNLALGGTGAITLDNSGGLARLGGSYVLYAVGAALTVQGAGEVGFDQSYVSNAGLISANVAGGTLTVDPYSGSGGAGNAGGTGDPSASFVNTGIMQATGGGTLAFNSGRYDNTGGTVRALAGSTVALNSDVRLTGGTLASTGSGRILATNGTVYLTDTALASGSNLRVDASVGGENANVNGTFTNSGTVTIASGANGNARFGAEGGNVATAGAGTITLDNSGGNRALLGGSYTVMTLGANQIVQGAGEVGFDQTYIVNNGLITANVNGATLQVDPYAGNGGVGGVQLTPTADANAAWVNNGTMQATNGGTLRFLSGRYDNTNGAIAALTGSTVYLDNDVRLIGGTLSSTGTGQLFSTNANIYLQNTSLASGSTLRLDASVGGENANINTAFTNNGAVTITSSPNGNVRLGAESSTNADIGGTGTITLDNSGGNRAQLGGSYTVMTLGAGQTVQGAGEVGYDQTYVVNNGLITANVSGATLYVDPYTGSGGNSGVQLTPTADANAAWVNNGTMQATNGGTLRFYSGRYDNTNGSIQALTGSTVYLDNDVRLIGGSLTSSGTGQFFSTNATTYLQNATLTTGTALNLSASVGGVLSVVNGALTNNGSILIASGTNGNAQVGLGEGNASLAGTGTITLDNSGGNRALLGGSFQVLTIGAGQTVQGRGEVGFDQTYVVNNGLITANVSGGTLYVDPYTGSGGISGAQLTPTAEANSVWVNNGTMQATNGGQLHVNGGRYDNSAGTIRALAGSTVYLDNDARIIGGTLSSTGSGQLFSTNANIYLQNTTLAAGSNLLLTSSGNGVLAVLNGTLTNNGAITVRSSTNGDARIGLGEGNATLAGTGTVTLDNSGGNRALLGGAFQVLTIGAGQTVNGAGEIGYDQTYLINNGNIRATAGTITVDPYAGSGGVAGTALGGADAGATVFNTGIIQADNGGNTLNLNGGRYEQAASGSFAAGTGSTFAMLNDANLVNLEAGGVLDRGLYQSITGGATSLVALRSAAASSIVQIGTDHAGIDTTVTLFGANSVLEASPLSDGTPTTI